MHRPRCGHLQGWSSSSGCRTGPRKPCARGADAMARSSWIRSKRPRWRRPARITDLVVRPQNRATQLIEDFMIAANTAMATFLDARGSATIRRVVKVPERWDRIVVLAAGLGERLPATPDSGALSTFLAKRRTADPAHFPDLSLAVVKLMGPGVYLLEKPGEKGEEHFGLAVHDYTHSTAPNRRYADLVTQRLLKAVLASRQARVSGRRARAARRSMHQDGRCGEEGRANLPQTGCGGIARRSNRREFRRNRHWRVGQGHLRPNPAPSGRRNGGPRPTGDGRRRQGHRPADWRQPDARIHRLCAVKACAMIAVASA